MIYRKEPRCVKTAWNLLGLWLFSLKTSWLCKMLAGDYFLNNNNMETIYNYFTYFSFFSSSSLWFVCVENELMRLAEVCMFMHKVNQTPSCYNMSERKNVLPCKTVRTGGIFSLFWQLVWPLWTSDQSARFEPTMSASKQEAHVSDGAIWDRRWTITTETSSQRVCSCITQEVSIH